MVKKFTLELKWNNTVCRARCPITGDSFKPFFGMYPFLINTLDPVSLDSLEEFNKEIVNEILFLSNLYYEKEKQGILEEIPESILFEVYYPPVFMD